MFIRDFVVPYLSEIYHSLDKIENLGYVREETIKRYLSLNEVVGNRLMQLINANSDPLIDHDEWLEYMLMLLCGSFERRLFIVFQIFDLNKEEIVRPQNMKLILKHLPVLREQQRLYGISHEHTPNDAHLPRTEIQRRRHADSNDIEQFVDIFFGDHPEGMVFHTFKQSILQITSEPFFAIVSHFQELIPLYQNYLKARSNFFALASRNS